MVSSGSIHRLLATFGAMLWLLCLSAGSAMAAEPATCHARVHPRAAAAGSVFVFSGSGFVPTQLTLERSGSDPIEHDLNVGGDDPWETTVRSRAGDEGIWTASFADPALKCTARVEFRVTLSNTDLIGDIAAATTSSTAPVLLYLAVIVLGFGGGLVLGRRLMVRTRGR